MRVVASVVLLLAATLSACASVLPLDCADDVSYEDCHHAYNLAEDRLTGGERPTAAWVGIACPGETCPAPYLDTHLLVVFLTPSGRVGVAVDRRTWYATRFQGDPAVDPWSN
jgi:hypothetical protein